MDHFHVVENQVGTRIALLVDWLCGCAHRSTSFPITLRGSVSGSMRNGLPETYIVCLACGRQFSYDWDTMRIARQHARVAQPAVAIPPVSGKLAVHARSGNLAGAK
jgi:hypothetical protein